MKVYEVEEVYDDSSFDWPRTSLGFYLKEDVARAIVENLKKQNKKNKRYMYNVITHEVQE